MRPDTPAHGLKAQWSAFLKVLLDPWVLLLGATAVFTGRASLEAAPQSAAAALTLVASVASGLLGGRAAQRWGTLTEERVILARGKTAVRSLKLHLGSVADFERRARVFSARCSGVEEGREPFSPSMAFEEVVGRCRNLQEQVLSSIENWTDIVPEADIKTQIGEITRLAQENDEQVGEVRRLKEELADTKNQSASARRELEAELSKREKLLRETQRKLAESTSSIRTFTGLSVPGIPFAGQTHFSPQATCSKCGRQYSDVSLFSSLVHGNMCPDCRPNWLSGSTG